MAETDVCDTISTPDCARWESTGYAVLRAWQRDRCGMCGASGALVMDHDHDTGLIRGYLCRGCNRSEAGNDAEAWRRWRTDLCPAVLLGVREQYRGIEPSLSTDQSEADFQADLDLIAEAVSS